MHIWECNAHLYTCTHTHTYPYLSVCTLRIQHTYGHTQAHRHIHTHRHRHAVHAHAHILQHGHWHGGNGEEDQALVSSCSPGSISRSWTKADQGALAAAGAALSGPLRQGTWGGSLQLGEPQALWHWRSYRSIQTRGRGAGLKSGSFLKLGGQRGHRQAGKQVLEGCSMESPGCLVGAALGVIPGEPAVAAPRIYSAGEGTKGLGTCRGAGSRTLPGSLGLTVAAQAGWLKRLRLEHRRSAGALTSALRYPEHCALSRGL